MNYFKKSHTAKQLLTPLFREVTEDSLNSIPIHSVSKQQTLVCLCSFHNSMLHPFTLDTVLIGKEQSSLDLSFYYLIVL